MSPPGRPKGEYRSAQHEAPVSVSGIQGTEKSPIHAKPGRHSGAAWANPRLEVSNER